MLEAARRALCDAGVLRAGDPMPPFSVRMSGNLVFLVYPGGGAFYAVKIGAQTDLRREHEGLIAGHRLFPDGVPEVLAWSRHRSFPTLVMRGIPYTPLSIERMRRFEPLVADRLTDFFATCCRSLREPLSEPASERIRRANGALDRPVPEATWSAYCAEIANEVDRMPAVRQHGDFYIHNLGIHRDALVVLDWEDFGLESLPGFDLALLLLSLNDFDIALVRTHAGTGAPHAWILEAGCTACGIAPESLLHLLPAYVALAALMKQRQGYGDEFELRAKRALAEAMCGSGTAVAAEAQSTSGAGPLLRRSLPIGAKARSAKGAL